MTKDELIYRLKDTAPINVSASFMREIVEFLESNVCIPKGENRHKDADVLHEWIEGAECEYKNTIGRLDGWKKLCFPLSEYRIKPSEPIYEYLFYSPEGSTKWMTIQESEMDVYFIQAKETKRERK